MKIHLIALLLFVAMSGMPAVAKHKNSQPNDSLKRVWSERSFKIPDRCVNIYDSRHPKIEKLWRVDAHPAFDAILTPEKETELLAEVHRRWDSLGRDSLPTCDILWTLRPCIDFLRCEDPHYRLFPKYVYTNKEYKNSRQFARRVVAPPFDCLCINDSLIVQQSLDPQLRCGDMITSINGKPAEYYLKYSYGDRYNDAFTIMYQAHFSHLVDGYDIEFMRGGEPHTATVASRRSTVLRELSQAKATERNIRTYGGCGYIAIPEFFPFNSRLIKIIHRAILGFRQQGITDVILDLRLNGGGNGDRFDELMSIFIDKPVVKYCKGQRVKVSDATLGWYDFLTEDMKGQMVDLPSGEYAAEFATDPKMYVGGMKYYVMMSRNTGSIAASFCNIMQYNGVGVLVGEPLLHNALKYGETVGGKNFLPVQLEETAVSTVEIDEYTLAEDGVLRPDIEIPYVAADYLSGRDAMLEKLLEIIVRK